MGYRSDIVIVVANEFVEEFESLFRKALNSDDNWEFWDEKKSDYWAQANGAFSLYQLFGWKWYDTDPQLNQIEEWLQNLNNLQAVTKSTRQGCLVRLGEEFGDYEDIVGNGYDFDIYPEQTIRIDY